MEGTMTMQKKAETYFWKVTGKDTIKVNISLMLLRNFMIAKGFGLFQIDTKRTSAKDLFQNDNGVLRIHDANTAKRWIRTYLEHTDDSEFENEGKFYCGRSVDKLDVLDTFQTFQITPFQNLVINDLPVYADSDFPDCVKLKLFQDKLSVAHVRFRNGIVKVTASDMKILPIDSLKKQGAVWESMLLPYDIKFDETKGLFETFAERAMSRKNHDKNDEDWTKNYDLDEEEYESMKCSFGYLLHTYNAPDTQKLVMFIDADSDANRAEGRNGKSFIMQQIKRFKSYTYVDGKRFASSMSDGGRFQFSGVTAETKFVWIDDVQPAFPFTMIFNMITGEMEIEKKNKDKVTILPERKPKFGLTTNYALPQFGTSFTARQHIVEFGNYWNYATQLNETPSEKKHLGKMLFEEDFTASDWNQFFTYGFKCIQEFFKKGLIQSESSNYEVKARKVAVEGQGGDGVVTQWMQDWIDNESKNYPDGISARELYSKFCHDNLLYIPEGEGDWNMKKFDTGFFDYVDLHPDYEFNKHLSKKGKSKSARRWLQGARGQQEPHIIITKTKK